MQISLLCLFSASSAAFSLLIPSNFPSFAVLSHSPIILYREYGSFTPEIFLENENCTIDEK